MIFGGTRFGVDRFGIFATTAKAGTARPLAAPFAATTTLAGTPRRTRPLHAALSAGLTLAVAARRTRPLRATLSATGSVTLGAPQARRALHLDLSATSTLAADMARSRPLGYMLLTAGLTLRARILNTSALPALSPLRSVAFAPDARTAAVPLDPRRA